MMTLWDAMKMGFGVFLSLCLVAAAFYPIVGDVIESYLKIRNRKVGKK